MKSHFPEQLRYTKDHEWVEILDDNHARIGITDYA
ncbi:MAG: glycine cleavage system protein H, partial [Candidatus Wallbacteria bacterium]|nr:glycine cleavage system protein H [Candidatus Wallbacteria bacterium]